MFQEVPYDVLFNTIVVEADFDFGLALWAGSEPNQMTGYYENSSGITIPVFASKIEHSAFIMWDLFEGLNGVEDYKGLIDYYRNTYFNSDLDVTYLLRDGATLMYCYWPNGLDDVWKNISANLLTGATVKGVLDRYANSADTLIEEHVVPNTVAIEKYRAEGFFD